MDKALQSFQRSLQLNPKQPDVLAEVCQMLLDDPNLDANRARYWCDLAESEKIQHDAVFSLRLKLMNKENSEINHVEELIQKEIAARPNDIQLRVRLVRSYIEQNKILDAFKYVYNLEVNINNNNQINDHFAGSSEWYSIVWLLLNKYEHLPNVKKDWEFWLLVIICLERQVLLSFSQQQSATSATGGVTETANLLFNLDQYLYKVSELADKLLSQKELVALFQAHYAGQLLLHASALILKREILQNKNKWKETIKSVLPLLLLAYQCDVAAETKELWMKHCDERGKQLIQLWNREGSFRCAQAGRTLLSCIVDETADKENAAMQINNQSKLWSNCDELLSQIRQTCADKQWRRNIFALLFCNSDHKVKEQSSLLVKCSKMNEPQYELPTYADVERYEEQAQYYKPQSLPHMVYLCLGNDNLAYVRAKYFSGLNFSTQNLAFCGAESLNQLDVDTFLYAAALQAKRMLEVDREAFQSYNSGNRSAISKPRILPFVNLQTQLSTEEQINWWTAAYQVYKNLKNENFAEIRANLQFGIEAVRGINGPKIDMIIVFKLGQIFVARAQDLVKPIEKAHLEARAESIYRYGLNMVKMHNKGVLEPFRKYFKYSKSNTSAVEREVFNIAEDAVSYLASRFFKKAEYEELIEELAGIQLPFATYLQAEAYRKLDESNKTPKKSKRVYLDRASECLNQTLLLLKNTQTDPNHPLNSIIYSELKRVQQAAARLSGGGDNISYSSSAPIGVHNNSSTYEDAEADFYSGTSMMPTPASHHRFRRDTAAAAVLASPMSQEIENLVKQMATTLAFVKEEIVDAIKPEVVSMHKEITSLKEKVAHLEDAMKKARIPSNPPSRDDASHVLDDLYMIEDALQNQMYQQTPPTHLPTATQNMLYPFNAQYNTLLGGTMPVQQSQQQPQQQQRIQHTSNVATMQMQQNAAVVAAAAAAYNSPMFNPNFPMNYFTPQFMMPPQVATSTGGVLGHRNPIQVPYMDVTAGAMNFNIPSTGSLLPPPPAPTQEQQQRAVSSMYGFPTAPQIQQQQQQQPPTIATQTIPQFPTIKPQISVPSTSVLSPLVSSITSAATTLASNFNKAINNQPVEKGPPANVVITSSDPLPNPNCASLQVQKPTLTVTIPSHHIKPSLVSAANDGPSLVPLTTIIQPPHIFGSLSMNTTIGTAPFTGFTTSTALASTTSATVLFANSKSSMNNNNIAAVTTVSPSTFSFKPQIEAQAAMTAVAAAAAADDSSLNNTAGSVGSIGSGGTDHEAEYDPRPDFKPIIPLPEEIEVKTGEEEEQVMFCHRAKLFRLIDKEWKERGIGDIKILKNKNGSSRILMRRDQTHKVCANHKITSDLQLTAPQNQSKCHIWVAHDFADEELKLETFFVRFKHIETANQFGEAFRKAREEDMQKRKTLPVATEPTRRIETNKSNMKQAQQQAESSKPPPFHLVKCTVTQFATSTPATKGGGILNKPITGHEAQVTATSMEAADATAGTTNTTIISTNATTTTTAVSKTLFGIAATSKPNATSQSKQNIASSSSAPFASFSFNKPMPATAITTSAPLTTTQTMTGVSTISPFGNIFNSLAKSQPSPFSTANLPKSFADIIKSDVPPQTAEQLPSSLNKSNVSADGDDEYVPTAQFNPVIPLPDLIEASTGEENEIVLFEHRAKLLRFDKVVAEWKERGLGNIRILQHKDDANKVRLVMRREQIHKLCCNQRLYKDTCFKYAKNSETALTWAGQDYSENELVTEMLTVRFKTAEICKEFHAAIIKAQDGMSSETTENAVKVQEATEKEVTKLTSKEKETTQEAPPQESFGDAFKPKPGSWSCKSCYTSNEADKLYCAACEMPKNNNVPKKESSSLLSSSASNAFKFCTFKFGAANTANSNVQPVFEFNSLQTAANIDALKSIGGGATTVATPIQTTVSITSSSTTTTTSALSSGFGDKFKPKAGSWTCQACYLTNIRDDVYCSACEAPKDDTIPKQKPSSPNIKNKSALPSNITQKFNFGFSHPAAEAASTFTATTGGGFSFDAKPGEKPLSIEKKTDGNDIEAEKPSQQIITNTTIALNPSISKQTFSFSLQSSAMAAPTNPVADRGGIASPFTLPNKSNNTTLSQPKSPASRSGGGDGADYAEDADDSSGHHTEEENTTYFAPVIPLPEKIVVKTGEEDEELLYVHRAKLYRFVDGEWKERGLGDIKILRHKDTNKLRVVMRREQILKICLNHVLNDEIEYKRKDDKSWHFIVNDFSEGDFELHQFSLRFKNKEIAEAFMDAIKSALLGTAVALVSVESATKPQSTPKTEDNDVSIKMISDADRKKADTLKLPYDFFQNKPVCSGCRGCDVDTFVFPSLKSNELFVHQDDVANPLRPMELPELTTTGKEQQLNRSLLKQSSLSASVSSASAPRDEEKSSGSILKSFSEPNATLFGSDVKSAADKTITANTTFSFTAAMNSTMTQEDKKPLTGFVFGGTAAAFAPKSTDFIFGGGGGDNKAPIFGTAATTVNLSYKTTNVDAKETEKPKSIFEKQSVDNSNVDAASGAPIFGGRPVFSLKTGIMGEGAKAKSIFGGSNAAQSFASGNSIFGSTVFSGFSSSNTDNKSATQTSIFGGTNKTNVFSLGNIAKENVTAAASASAVTTTTVFTDIANKADSLDFASLAAKANVTPKNTADNIAATGSGGFIGLTSTNAFSSFQKANNKDDSKNSSLKVTSSTNNESNASIDDASATNDENYDPHYDPIIALPNKIVVSTGEEEEIKMFGERATLFRWDSTNKEWKERGVGELKILLHSTHKKYRMIMRREQIHKLVLNFAFGADFVYNNMNNNQKSFVWAGMNYAESSDGDVEKLAVRFKKVEVAEAFSKQLKECIKMAQKYAEEDKPTQS